MQHGGIHHPPCPIGLGAASHAGVAGLLYLGSWRRIAQFCCSSASPAASRCAHAFVPSVQRLPCLPADTCRHTSRAGPTLEASLSCSYVWRMSVWRMSACPSRFLFRAAAVRAAERPRSSSGPRGGTLQSSNQGSSKPKSRPSACHGLAACRMVCVPMADLARHRVLVARAAWSHRTCAWVVE